MKAKSAAIMLMVLAITLVPTIAGTAGIAEAASVYEVASPRIVEDSAQGTGYVTTWDCIYFGEYWQNDMNGDGLCFEKDTTVSRTQVIDSDGDGVYSDEDSSIYGDGRLYTDRDGCYYTELVDGVEKLFQERIVIDALSAAFNPGETSHVFAADSKEPIKWRVLNYDSNTGEALILSDALIEKFDFYSPTWSSNEMRSFLNSYDGAANSNGVDHTSGGFLTNAFSARERADIIKSDVINADNPVYGTDGGEDTSDWVFCLSIDEAMTWEYGFISNEFIYRTREGQLEGSKFDRSAGDNARAATSTTYVNSKPGYDNSDSWWLRTPGYSSNAVAWVDSGGGVNTPWSYYLKVPAVRPALRINLKASSNWKNAGTVNSNGEQTPADEGTTEAVVTDDPDSGASTEKESDRIKLTSSNTTIVVKDVKYTGKAQKPSVTVKYKGEKLKKDTDYSVSYSNNINVGKATVKVTGKGNYKGTVKSAFKIKSTGKKVYALAFGAAKGEETSSTDNVKKMYKAFLGLEVPGYGFSMRNVVKKDCKGFTKKRLLNAIDKACGKATSSDISFIYINAHGKKLEINAKGDSVFPGIAIGDGFYAWSDVIEDLGSHIKGKIVLLTEMCYSGNFVKAAKNSTIRNRIAVITAAGKTFEANQVDDVYFNKFIISNAKYTKALARGLGYKTKRLAADKNADRKVTLGELNSYIVNDKELQATGQRPMSYFGGSLKKFVIYKK